MKEQSPEVTWELLEEYLKISPSDPELLKARALLESGERDEGLRIMGAFEKELPELAQKHADLTVEKTQAVLDDMETNPAVVIVNWEAQAMECYQHQLAWARCNVLLDADFRTQVENPIGFIELQDLYYQKIQDSSLKESITRELLKKRKGNLDGTLNTLTRVLPEKLNGLERLYRYDPDIWLLPQGLAPEDSITITDPSVLETTLTLVRDGMELHAAFSAALALEQQT